MSWTSTIVLMLAALCAAAPAGAAPFMEKVGVWTIFSTGRFCTALNRDMEEFNFAPYNALSFVQAVGTPDVAPRLYAWPGAFDHGASVRLAFALPGVNLPISLPARTSDDFTVNADETLSPERLGLIAKAGLVTVQVTGGARLVKPLAFQTADLAPALEALGRCAKAS